MIKYTNDINKFYLMEPQLLGKNCLLLRFSVHMIFYKSRIDSSQWVKWHWLWIRC